MTESLALKAAQFKSLHKPGNPVILANVYDIPTANLVASLPGAQALATASYAVALASGLTDPELDLETNLAAVEKIAPIAVKAGKPLTVDFQDGYDHQLEDGIRKLIKLGVVGINLEDSASDGQGGSRLLLEAIAVDRIKRVLKTAAEVGVPDFVVNARSDELLVGAGNMQDCISRGKAYLEAGATTVFVFGGPKRGGLNKDEVTTLAEGLDGRLNVSFLAAKPESQRLSIQQLKEIGVARISIGPQLLLIGTAAQKKAAEEMFV
jgi:2-methylisocitrate lyase-like PEP mutase family enzyme